MHQTAKLIKSYRELDKKSCPMLSSALTDASFDYSTHKKRRQYITVDFQDGKQDIIRFGRQNGSSPPRVMIQTEDPDRIQQLKMLGLAKGSTPSAQAIAIIGKYKRDLLKETRYGYITKGWEDKWRIAQETQEALIKIEADERALVPDDFKGQEKIREKIIQIIDIGLKDNEKLSKGITSTPGRLHDTLRNARTFIQGEYRFPYTEFSKADQLYFDEQKDALGQPAPFIYDSAMHLDDGDDALSSIQALYKNFKTNEQKIPTQNPLKRGGFYKKITSPIEKESNLIFLDLARRGYFKRFYYNSKEIFKSIPTTFSEGYYQAKAFTQKEWRDLLYIEAPKQQTDLKKQPELSENEEQEMLVFKEKIKDLQAQALKHQSEKVMVQPEHSYAKSMLHDNLISQLMVAFSGEIHAVEKFGVSNPVSMTVITALSALTFGSMVTPHLISVFLKQLGIQNPELVIHTIQFMMHSVGSSDAINFFTVYQLASLEKKVAFMLSEHANQLVWSQWKAVSENPVDLSVFLIEAITFSIQIAHISSASKNPEEMAAHLAKLDYYGQINTNVDRLRILNGIPKKDLNIIASILVFPIQLISAPLRLLLSPFVALPACLKEKSLEPLYHKTKQELNHFRSQIGRAFLASVDILAMGLEIVYSIITFYPNVFFKFTCILFHAPLATLATGLTYIGLAKVGSFFKTLADDVIDFKYWVEKNAGQLNRSIVRNLINWPNHKIHELLQPKNIENRLKRLHAHFSTLKAIYKKQGSANPIILELISDVETSLKNFSDSDKPDRYQTLKKEIPAVFQKASTAIQFLEQKGTSIPLKNRLQNQLSDLISTTAEISSTPIIPDTKTEDTALLKQFHDSSAFIETQLKNPTTSPQPEPPPPRMKKTQDKGDSSID